MLTVKITVHDKHLSEVEAALELIREALLAGETTGRDEQDDTWYSFEVEGEEET